MRQRLKILLATICFSPFAICFGEVEEAIEIPIQQLDKYSHRVHIEQLESMKVQRLRLEGPQTIIMDILAEHDARSSAEDFSAKFSHYRKPEFSTTFYSFPTEAFSAKLNAENLNRYLEAKALLFPEENGFQLIEEAIETTGRAKFRLFGKRALSIAYQVSVEEQPITFRENWVEIDGVIYVIRVEAPSSVFDSYFRYVKDTVNSIHFAS